MTCPKRRRARPARGKCPPRPEWPGACLRGEIRRAGPGRCRRGCHPGRSSRTRCSCRHAGGAGQGARDHRARDEHVSSAGPPGEGRPRCRHAPGFAETARNGPNSRLSPVPVFKIPPLRALERDRAGSLPVHGTVSAGCETNRLPSSKIQYASPAFPARLGQPAHLFTGTAACSVAMVVSWEKPVEAAPWRCRFAPKLRTALLGKALSGRTRQPSAASWESTVPPHRSAIAASWEKYFPPTPLSHRQPLGKSTFRPHPSAFGSLLGKPAAERPRRCPSSAAQRSSARAPAPASPFAAPPADAAVRSGRSSLRLAARRLLRIDAVGNFLAKYQYVLRRLDAQADLVAFHPEHPHGDTLSDPHGLAHPATQNQHAQTPFRYAPAHKPCARRRITVGIRRHESRKCTRTRPRERSCRDGHRHPIQ